MSGDLRSQKVLFVAHCMLARPTMAEGLVKKFPAVVTPLVEFAIEYEVALIQMPCPEAQCCGLRRSPHGKAWYEAQGLRKVAKGLAENQVSYIKEFVSLGYQVIGIVGVEFSPSCAVGLMFEKGRTVHDSGIFIEEISRLLEEYNLQVPFIGFNRRAIKKFKKELLDLVVQPQQPFLL